MTVITIDTEKDSVEHINHAIDFLQKVANNSTNVEVTTSFGLPSSGVQTTPTSTSANDLLNMCDDEEDTEEIKPSEGLTDFSQFIPF